MTTENHGTNGDHGEQEELPRSQCPPWSGISRRRMLELGAAATAGVIVTTINKRSAQGEPARLSGLASEYDQYDGLGLAALVAKREVTPLELLNAVRQRLEAINPKINAVAQI